MNDPRFRVGNKQPRNVYDDADFDAENQIYGRWMATAGDPADAAKIVEALNFMAENSQ